MHDYGASLVGSPATADRGEDVSMASNPHGLK
jgi:hypothetical protein